jgi:NitT/TauT family transport system substrate-binding protein
VVSGFYDHTVQMAAEGRDLVAFVTILRYPGLVLVTSPQSAGDVTDVTKLRNRVAGVTTPGSSSQMLLTFLLTKHQVPPDSVSIVTIGSAATAIAAIERGKVDAGWVAEPSFTVLTKRNPAVKVLADLRDERGTMTALGTKTYPASVFYSSREWIDAHRETAAGLARAMRRTLQWMHANTPAEIAAKTPKPLRGEDDAVYVEAIGHSMPMFSTDGVMTAEGAEAVRTLLAGSMVKVRGAAIDLSKTYTNEFVTLR